MAMKFQYDEQGDTFLYFVLAFLLLVLLPSSYMFWPRGEEKDADKQGFKCACDNCEHKRSKLRASQPKKRLKRNFIKIILTIGWILVAFIAYTVATTKREVIDWNPYEILELEPGATVEDIKRQYRKLSRVYHPDRQGGNESKFINITKAHAALTDDAARENWERYGNPDGPGVTEFGIALPVWLVQGKNSIWVLGLYGLVFMVLLPTIVGVWWYRSIRYTSEAVLIETTKIIKFYFYRSSTLNIKRVLLILSGACEFETMYNPEIVQRPDDNLYIPAMLKSLGTVQEKIKDRPFGAPYSVKARTLLLAHLERMEIPARYLREDLDYILKKCPMLIQEMVSTCAILMQWYYTRQIPTMPSIETVENVMKLSQMLVQGLSENCSPLLQLPNIDNEILRHFFVKKRNIKSMVQFLRFPAEERRKLLRNLTDKQYNDVISVCNAMPHVDAAVSLKVVDDEDEHTVTADAIVTVNVTLKRANLGEWIETAKVDTEKEAPETETEVQEAAKTNSKSAHRRNKKKSKGKKVQNVKKGKKGQGDSKENAAPAVNVDEEGEKLKKVNGTVNKAEDSESDESDSGSDSEDEKVTKENGRDESDDNESVPQKDAEEDLVDNEDKKDEDYLDLGEGGETIPDLKSKFSHPVHCPYFPEEKQEWWWVFLVDKKKRRLVSPPMLVTNLVSEESVQLKFTAPSPGTYNYSVVVKSDSYLDVDTVTNLKFEVKEKKEVDMNNPQWDISESDEEKQDEQDDIYASETDESDE
ncbi:translocation protein SEC63 homolog [Paramacrobiotus metropolitanus]|uniref:translocation protein SEC63 homolog n=1 Tax=Paramacrobiotus metropolitanus TaxID=2943436 RepID=UPI00244578AB|nr:translocation protein SEC63 homolog [Paramacrobiotus metropolitanus]